MNENNEYVTNVTVSGLKCLRCSWTWLPRKVNEIPLTCPHCHSSYWRRPRIRPKKTKIETPVNGLDQHTEDVKAE